MLLEKKRVTAEEFEEFVELPENSERMFELIGGEIVEVPSNPYSSKLSMRFGRYIGNVVDEHDLGHVTGEQGGYMVSGERYAPDVGFISKARQPELARKGYNPLPPDLAVEAVSPTDKEDRLSIKIANYLAAGTIVWLARPEYREVEVYVPGQPVKIVDINGELDGGTVLPGFKLALKDIFK